MASGRQKINLTPFPTIRHLYGMSLPAHVIRTALKHPHSSQGLVDLSELWELFKYDPMTRTVDWRKARTRRSAANKLLPFWPLARYVLFASLAVGAAYVATQTQGPTQWAYSIFAMIMAVGAAFALWRSDVEKTAATVGEAWLARINADAAVWPDPETTESTETPFGDARPEDRA